MPKALLTDLDGTLLDSNALHAEAWRRAFEHFGIQTSLAECWSQIGKGGDKVVPAFVPEGDCPRLEEPLKQFRKEVFHRDYMPRIVPFARARDLLVRVRQQGMKIALATSSNQEDLATYSEIIGMEDLVDEASSSADAKESKPDPDIFAAACRKIGISIEDAPRQAVALGDTPWDAQSAGKLGIPVIGLTCGGWKRDDLLHAGCVAVFQDPADLLLHFNQSPLAG